MTFDRSIVGRFSTMFIKLSLVAGDIDIIKGFEEMMDSIEKGFNETMNVSYPEVERNELELITEYYMGVR